MNENVMETLQTHQAIILIKCCLLVNSLFVESILHSKWQIYSFALQIGWDILLKNTWDFCLFPMAHQSDWCETGGRWMKIAWSWLSGDQAGLQCCSVSAWDVSDWTWQPPYGFQSRRRLHTNRWIAHRQKSACVFWSKTHLNDETQANAQTISPNS